MISDSPFAEQASRATTIAIIRRKAIEAFGRHGLDVERIDGTTLGNDIGMRFPLENLVGHCLDNSRSVWDKIIDMHARTMVQATRDPDPSTLSDDEFFSRVRERVLAPNVLDRFSDYDYSRPLVEDAPVSPQCVLGLSFPGRAFVLADRHLVGRNIETAWAAGRANTASVEFDDYEELRKNGIRVEVRRGNSIFLASKVADMRTLITDHLGTSPNGVLFAIPNSYEIDYYRPRSSDDAMRAVPLLADIARMFCTEPSPLSPNVFFWQDGEFSLVHDGYAEITASRAE